MNATAIVANVEDGYPDVEPAGEQRRMRSDFVNGIKYLRIRLDRVRA